MGNVNHSAPSLISPQRSFVHKIRFRPLSHLIIAPHPFPYRSPLEFDRSTSSLKSSRLIVSETHASHLRSRAIDGASGSRARRTRPHFRIIGFHIGRARSRLKQLMLIPRYRVNFNAIVADFPHFWSFPNPTILSPIAFYRGKQRAAFVTNYSWHGSLAALLDSSRKIDLAKQSRIFFGVASGMRTLHSRGIVHGNLQPSNVLLFGDMAPKICDYGLHSFVRPTKGDERGPYLAPEATVPSEKADAFASGMMIFRVLSGGLPRPRQPRAFARGERPPLSEAMPAFFRELIARCWAHNPAERPSFSEIVQISVSTDLRLPGFVEYARGIEPGLFLQIKLG
jgi:hypothetical protein